MKFLGLFLCLLFPGSIALSENVFRIEVGDNYDSHSNKELRRRVWQLERAVWQMQQRIYQLEAKPKANMHTWVCTLSPFSSNYSETGASKATASAAVIKACTLGEKSGFHCKNPKCSR